jgi:hypothetical protein
MNYSDLVVLKDDALAKISDENFCAKFFDEFAPGEVFFSKGASYTIIPLELEMSGVAPSKGFDKEPASKKNLSKYFLHDGQVVKIEGYNSQGLLDEVEFVRFFDGRLCSLRKNKHNEVLWLKIVELKDGMVLRACRVDGDLDYWAYRYNWEGGRVREVVSLASNGVAGTVIKAEYDVDSTVVRLFFLNNGKEVDIYSDI